MSRYTVGDATGDGDAFGDDGAAEATGRTVRASVSAAAQMPGCRRSLPGPEGLRAMADSMCQAADNGGAALADVSFLTLCAAVVAARQSDVGWADFRHVAELLYATPLDDA